MVSLTCIEKGTGSGCQHYPVRPLLTEDPTVDIYHLILQYSVLFMHLGALDSVAMREEVMKLFLGKSWLAVVGPRKTENAFWLRHDEQEGWLRG